MIMAKLKSAKGKKFLFGLLAVFIIAASVVTRATIGGVIEPVSYTHLDVYKRQVFIIAASVVTRATIGGVIEQYNICLLYTSRCV
ncbi:hypothetical protein A4T35_07930 [Escherichia coli]|uniref:DUF2534 family protein n=1 Tax=Escherichia coli TaxID=562 RepID=UPI0009FC21EF|nr:hypothetical protein A4T35_07930 [Escherichia coli]